MSMTEEDRLDKVPSLNDAKISIYIYGSVQAPLRFVFYTIDWMNWKI